LVMKMGAHGLPFLVATHIQRLDTSELLSYPVDVVYGIDATHCCQ